MDPNDNTAIAKQMEEVLATAGRPGFIIYGWKKDDGTFGIVQTLKEMDLLAYYQGVSKAMSSAIPNAAPPQA